MRRHHRLAHSVIVKVLAGGSAAVIGFAGSGLVSPARALSTSAPLRIPASGGSVDPTPPVQTGPFPLTAHDSRGIRGPAPLVGLTVVVGGVDLALVLLAVRLRPGRGR